MNGYLNEAADLVRDLASLEIEVAADGTLIFVDSDHADRLSRSARDWINARNEFHASLRRKEAN